MTIPATLVAVTAVLLAEPRHTTDQSEPANERAARMTELASTIALFAKTDEHTALMATVAIHESKLAGYVARGRCDEGPKGQQCDGFRSRGYFQNRLVSCKLGWFMVPGSPEELFAFAQCSARDLFRGFRECGTAEGAFAAFNGSRSCTAPWAKSRVATFKRILGKLQRKAAES